MDGTDNKNKFGANAILGVSMAVAKVTTAWPKNISWVGIIGTALEVSIVTYLHLIY